MPQENPRKALGKGLGALFPTRAPLATVPEPTLDSTGRIAIELIDPNPVQPRRVFQADSLHQLADSIVQHGIIQPLVVRLSGTRYQLVAGERRWRAPQIPRLKANPPPISQTPPPPPPPHTPSST